MGCEVGEWGEWVHSLKLHPRYAWQFVYQNRLSSAFFSGFDLTL